MKTVGTLLLLLFVAGIVSAQEDRSLHCFVSEKKETKRGATTVLHCTFGDTEWFHLRLPSDVTPTGTKLHDPIVLRFTPAGTVLCKVTANGAETISLDCQQGGRKVFVIDVPAYAAPPDLLSNKIETVIEIALDETHRAWAEKIVTTQAKREADIETRRAEKAKLKIVDDDDQGEEDEEDEPR